MKLFKTNKFRKISSFTHFLFFFTQLFKTIKQLFKKMYLMIFTKWWSVITSGVL